MTELTDYTRKLEIIVYQIAAIAIYYGTVFALVVTTASAQLFGSSKHNMIDAAINQEESMEKDIQDCTRELKEIEHELSYVNGMEDFQERIESIRTDLQQIALQQGER